MAALFNIQHMYNHLSRQIEEPVRQHLKNVYACLTLSGIAAAVGAYLHLYTIFALGGFLSSIAALIPICFLVSTPHNGTNTVQRMGYLLAASLFIGMGMGPLLQYAIAINPSLIITSLIGTALIFASFSVSVLYSKRGYWLFLIGPLSSFSSVMIFLCLGTLFFNSALIYKAYLYLGLLVMCGFVLFDTTLIIEKCRMGDKDFIAHALDLFIDLVGIFKRILIILAEKERNTRDRRKN